MADPIQSLPGEVWKPVVGYEGFYEVSNMGRVKSLARVVSRGAYTHSVSSRILRATRWGCGEHRTVRLSRGGVERSVLVHRIVLTAFDGQCPDGHEACHNDGDPTNNRIDNLRWDTHMSNMRDKHKHNTVHSKLTPLRVALLRQLYAAGVPYTRLARLFGVGPTSTQKTVTGILWAHLPMPKLTVRGAK